MRQGLRRLLQRKRVLEDVGGVVDLLGGEVVVERDGDAGAPGGLGKLGKLGELGNAEVAFLGPKLGAVEGLQVGKG